MSNSDQLNYLKKIVEENLKMYDGKRKRNKWLSFVIKISTALAAALISVLLGLSSPWISKDLAKNISLILGALITILNVWDSFFNHKALYVKATISMVNCLILKNELDYISTKPPEVIKSEDLDKIHDSLKNVILENSSHWLELRKEEKGK